MYGINVCMRFKFNIFRGGICYLNMKIYFGGIGLGIYNLVVFWYWDVKGFNFGIRNLGWIRDSYICY